MKIDEYRPLNKLSKKVVLSIPPFAPKSGQAQGRFVQPLGRPPKEVGQKNRILLEAAKAITSTGYEQCTLQDIASKVGLSRPALYYYFSTKQEIFSVIALTSAKGMYEFVLPRVDKEVHPIKKLFVFMTSHAMYFDSNFWMVNATIGYDVSYGGIAKRQVQELKSFESYRAKYWLILEEVIVDGVKRDIFDCENPRFVTRSVFQLLNIACWYDQGGSIDAVEVAKTNFRLVIRGLLRESISVDDIEAIVG